jgi:hypothetical protein
MSAEHVLDTIMRAGIWRAMHAVPPIAAAIIAAACILAALALRSRR